MDINKANKPIHIRCPYCKKDLQYNGASIKSQKEGLLSRMTALNNKWQSEKNPQRKKKYYKEFKEAQFRLKLLSEDIHMLSQMSEMEVLKIFKRNVKEYIDRDLYIKLVEEAEHEYLEENTFNYYDLAIQQFNNFSEILKEQSE